MASFRGQLRRCLKEYSEKLGIRNIPSIIVADCEAYAACLAKSSDDLVIFFDKDLEHLFKWKPRKAIRVLKFIAAHELAHAKGYKERGANRIAKELTGVSRDEFNEIMGDFQSWKRARK